MEKLPLDSNGSKILLIHNSLTEERLDEKGKGNDVIDSEANLFAQSSCYKQGWLKKQGGMIKTWKRRWFVLRDKRLYYYENEKSEEAIGLIPLEVVSIRAVEGTRPGQHYGFELYDANNFLLKSHPSFFMLTDTREDLISWMEEISIRIALAHKVKDNKKPEILKKLDGYLNEVEI